MTSSILQTYLKQGFVIGRSIIPISLINATLAELAIHYDVSARQIPSFCSSNDFLDYSFAAYKRQEIASKKLKSRKYDISPMLSSSFKIVSLLTELLDQLHSSAYTVDKLQFRFDDGSRSLCLHQEMFGMRTHSTITCWFPLCNTNKNQGGLSVIPYSHLLGHLPHKMIKNSFSFSSHGVDFQSTLMPNCEPTITLDTNLGDVVFFHPLLVHGTSLPMKPNFNRITLVFRADNVSDMEYLANEACDTQFIPQI